MKTVYLPSFTMGENAIMSIKDFFNIADKVAILYGNKAYKASKEYINQAINEAKLEVIVCENYGSDATYENVDRICNIDGISQIKALIAVGGGKCIDTVKVVGDILNKPVYSIPTIASTCAAVTKISIMYYENGAFKDVFNLKKPPVHTFIEPRIINMAPIKYLWAGIGDTMAKHVESTFSARNDVLDYASELGIKIGENCFYPMIRDGKSALNAAKEGCLNDELNRVIQNIIITTGSVSLLVNPNYNSALAHALYYGLTIRKVIEKNHLHGEVVSYGTLVQLMMDNQKDMLKKTYKFHKDVGLPTKLIDLEIDIDSNVDDILQETIINKELVHVPYPVTKELVYQAMKKLEEYEGE
ncbi:MAG: iron-containing alcohol dehydrogenase family protein [Erysipelotrichaceae bacterium]